FRVLRVGVPAPSPATKQRATATNPATESRVASMLRGPLGCMTATPGEPRSTCLIASPHRQLAIFRADCIARLLGDQDGAEALVSGPGLGTTRDLLEARHARESYTPKIGLPPSSLRLAPRRSHRKRRIASIIVTMLAAGAKDGGEPEAPWAPGKPTTRRSQRGERGQLSHAAESPPTAPPGGAGVRSPPPSHRRAPSLAPARSPPREPEGMRR